MGRRSTLMLIGLTATLSFLVGCGTGSAVRSSAEWCGPSVVPVVRSGRLPRSIPRPVNFLFDTTSQVGSKACWVAVVAGGDLPGHTALYRSLDGGEHWELLADPRHWASEAFLGAVSISFVNVRDGWILTEGAPGAGMARRQLLRTHDGGASWSVEGTTNGGLPITLANDQPQRMVFTSPTRGWIAGSNIYSVNPMLYRIEDGGASWSAVDLPLPPDGSKTWYGSEVRAVSFTRGGPRGTVSYEFLANSSNSNNRLYCYRTLDGGNSWTVSACPASR